MIGVAAGCAEGVNAGNWATDVASTDAGGFADVVSDRGGLGLDASGPGPEVRITSPGEGSRIAATTVEILGSSLGIPGVASVFVKAGPNTAQLATTTDGFKTWRIELPVPSGAFVVEAVAYDDRGLGSETPARVTLRGPEGTDTSTPTVRIESPTNSSTPLQTLVLVRGTATDDRGVVRMEVRRNDLLIIETPVATDDFFQHWSRLVPLLPGLWNELKFTAYDAAGNQGVANLRLQGRVDVDPTPPTVAIQVPSAGAQLNADTLAVRGIASDNVAVREVKVRYGVITDSSTTVFLDYVSATTQDAYASWSSTLPIVPGVLLVEARAIDINGLATSVTTTVTNSFLPLWSTEVEVPLRTNERAVRPMLSMDLDRTGVTQVINEDTQKAIKLLSLEPTPLLTNALDAIKTACGTDWRNDKQTPTYDCTLTTLGKTFGTNWVKSPEFALVRLLTMTPANVVVDGTSIEALKNVANNLNKFGLIGTFNNLLAQTLGLARTTEIVTTPNVMATLRNRWMASHPAVDTSTPGAVFLPIYLYDAMQDLAPMGARFGAIQNGHPGVLSSAPYSKVLDDTFRMHIVATSNLRWFEGLVADTGKDYMAALAGATDVLDFDFTKSSTFDILGLVAAPTVDLRLRIQENPAFIKACTGSACKANTYTSPYGTGYVWSTPQWQLENIIAYAANTQYGSRRYYNCFLSVLFCFADVSVGQGSDPAGWTIFSTALSIGSPPPAQFLWELINEVGQVAMHQQGAIPEGQANVEFTLSKIPVGLTADQIRLQVRGALQTQRSKLSDMLLGDYTRNNAALDAYLARGADGLRYFYYAARTDPRPATSTYPYTKPGFFSDEALASKVSTTGALGSGNTANEKVKLDPGARVLYIQGANLGVYRLSLNVPTDTNADITVRVARKMR
jgi:hypothetical protein